MAQKRETKSPNLGVVSDGGQRLEHLQLGHERRRLPRLNLAREQFRLTNHKIFSVADLSANGMALRILDQEDMRMFPVTTLLEGTLNLHGEKHALKARVVHLGNDFVGCQFEKPSASVQSALARFLDPAELGRELKPIPAPERGTLWYRGPSGTSLLLWRGADGQYRRLALFLLGTFIQWDVDVGLSTGSARPSDGTSEISGIIRFDTMLLDSDPSPDQGKLDVAKTLVMSSNLPQDLKKWCVRQLSAAAPV